MRYKVHRVGDVVYIKLPRAYHFDAGNRALDHAGHIVRVRITYRYANGFAGVSTDGRDFEYTFNAGCIVRSGT